MDAGWYHLSEGTSADGTLVPFSTALFLRFRCEELQCNVMDISRSAYVREEALSSSLCALTLWKRKKVQDSSTGELKNVQGVVPEVYLQSMSLENSENFILNFPALDTAVQLSPPVFTLDDQSVTTIVLNDQSLSITEGKTLFYSFLFDSILVLQKMSLLHVITWYANNPDKSINM